MIERPIHNLIPSADWWSGIPADFYKSFLIDPILCTSGIGNCQARTKTDDTAEMLSAREIEIVRMIAEGYGNKQIARKLCRSLHTVKNHVHRIIEKLSVTTRSEAARFALDRGWLIGSHSTSVSVGQGSAPVRLPAG